MSDREHAQVRIDIDVVRALLDGMLATPCHFVQTAVGRGVRQCVRHYAVEPCPVAELRRIRKDYEQESDDIVASAKEDWLASEEADDGA